MAVPRKISKKMQEMFIEKYLSDGKDSFYDFLLSYIEHKCDNVVSEELSPHNELYDYYLFFLNSYRKNYDATYLDICKCFRKAGQKAYRTLLHKGMVEEDNRFFNVVKNK